MCKMCEACKRCHLLLLRHGLVYHFTSVPRARTRRDPKTVEQSQWSKGPRPKRGKAWQEGTQIDWLCKNRIVDDCTIL